MQIADLAESQYAVAPRENGERYETEEDAQERYLTWADEWRRPFHVDEIRSPEESEEQEGGVGPYHGTIQAGLSATGKSALPA